MKKNFLVLYTMVFWLAACQSIEVSTHYDPALNLSTAKTYAWLNNGRLYVGYKPIDAKAADRYFRAAVDAQMSARGFSKAPGIDKADLLVNYHAAITSKIDVEETFKYDQAGDGGSSISGVGNAWPVAEQPKVREYDEGSLIVDILDPSNRNVLWRGEARAIIDYDASEKKRERRVRRAVKSMFDDFPVK